MMAGSTTAALVVGLQILGMDDGDDGSAALGTIALVAAPAITLVSILGNVLVGLLRGEK